MSRDAFLKMHEPARNYAETVPNRALFGMGVVKSMHDNHIEGNRAQTVPGVFSSEVTALS